jgi:hypothetical protein
MKLPLLSGKMHEIVADYV